MIPDLSGYGLRCCDKWLGLAKSLSAFGIALQQIRANAAAGPNWTELKSIWLAVSWDVVSRINFSKPGSPIPQGGAAVSPVSPGRIKQLDGVRGVAAMIVVVFHFLCLLQPGVVPDMTPTPVFLADTPVAILWNGPFAVSIFFVLSGFVIAGAAERRNERVITNMVTRYIRLAVPVLASVILAWILLSIFPTATVDLGKVLNEPSRWLTYTYQGEIPPLYIAVMEGLVTNFLSGESLFNNVLWTMRIELIGSFLIFGIYWLSAGKARMLILAFTGIVIFVLIEPAYLAFVLGALIHEANIRGLLIKSGNFLPYLIFAGGIILGSPGLGTAERWGLPDVPWRLTIGNPHGLIAVFAAALLIIAIISSSRLGRYFSTHLCQWLGRISFSLYLVHVPLLYTLVAATYVNIESNLYVMATAYFCITLSLAHVFTIFVDEPALRLLPHVRRRIQRCDEIFHLKRVT